VKSLIFFFSPPSPPEDRAIWTPPLFLFPSPPDSFLVWPRSRRRTSFLSPAQNTLVSFPLFLFFFGPPLSRPDDSAPPPPPLFSPPESECPLFFSFRVPFDQFRQSPSFQRKRYFFLFFFPNSLFCPRAAKSKSSLFPLDCSRIRSFSFFSPPPRFVLDRLPGRGIRMSPPLPPSVTEVS